MNELMINEENIDNQIIVYENGEIEINVLFDNKNETIWANI